MDNTLETTTFHTRRRGGRPVLISAEDAQASPKGVTTLTLKHTDITNRDEIELGRRVAASGLMAANGASDRSAMLLFKGLALATMLVKEWDRKTADDQPLAVSAENVETLPKAVLVEFGQIALYGKIDGTEDEAETEKKG